MIVLVSITLGLLIACLLCAVGYARLVREPERLRWQLQADRELENARYFQSLALKTLDRWQMLQGYPSLEDEWKTVDKGEEPAEDDEPASLLRLSDEDLAERLREMHAPRSRMDLSERRRVTREQNRRGRLKEMPVAMVEEEQAEGIVNELSMDQATHLRG